MQAQEKFDVIVYGATGFTGTLVAEYLLRQYGVGRELFAAFRERASSAEEGASFFSGND